MWNDVLSVSGKCFDAKRMAFGQCPDRGFMLEQCLDGGCLEWIIAKCKGV